LKNKKKKEKITKYYILDLYEGLSSSKRNFSFAEKKNPAPTFQMIILHFFSFWGLILAFLNPDPQR
jgi:hypothetical protein